jgi:RNA polymerase-interacting CarD/CdnL/TRCF family regulator
VDRADEMGLRQAPGKKEAKEILSVVSAPGELLPQEKRERRQLLASALRSKDIIRQAEIFRDLSWCDQRRGLSSREYWLYKRLKRVVGGELALAQGIDLGDAKELLEERVRRHR